MQRPIRLVSQPAPAPIDAVPDFEGFVLQHHERLFRALCLVTRDRHEAEDVMQEAFVRVLERWDRAGGMQDPTGYLYRTAMNVVRRRYRRALLAVRRAAGAIPREDSLAAIEDREAARRALRRRVRDGGRHVQPPVPERREPSPGALRARRRQQDHRDARDDRRLPHRHAPSSRAASGPVGQAIRAS